MSGNEPDRLALNYRLGADQNAGKGTASWFPLPDDSFNVHGQTTFAWLAYPPIRSPYTGPQSLPGGGQGRETFDATLYAGIRLWRGAEVWINPELEQGFGFDNTHGLAGFPTGEAFKLGFSYPYARLQRLFLRQTINLGGDIAKLDADINQFADTVTSNRLVLTVGRIFITDIFDTNKYANSSKTDFMNWSFLNAGTFDFAGDAWESNYGVVVEWYQNFWTLRAGVFDLSATPEGGNSPTAIQLDATFSQFQIVGEIEDRYQLWGQPGKLKITGFLSRGRAGAFQDAVELAQLTGQRYSPVIPVDPLGATSKQYVDSLIGGGGGGTPSNTPPLMDGIAAPGTATPYSREDHVHPTDTSLLPLAGGTLTVDLILRGPPTTDLMAPTKLYVDQIGSTVNLWQGVYDPTTNIPDLTNVAIQNNGWSWTVNVAGSTAVNLPGIPAGTALVVGDLLQWIGVDSIYAIIAGSPLTEVEADALYLRLSGGTMTGAIVLPTNPTTNVEAATKQYVDTVASSVAGIPSNMDGVAAPGTAMPYSRGDHVHPTDTSRAPLASPALTGTPTAPTVTPATDSSTKLATTAFVHNAISAVSSGVVDITVQDGLSGGGSGNVTIGITANGILNASLATMAAHTYKRNNTNAAATPIDVTAAQLMTDLGAAPTGHSCRQPRYYPHPQHQHHQQFQ
jgi:hypothetical protein